MFTLEVKVGRLMELRIIGSSSPADLDLNRQQMAHLFDVTSGNLVACVDCSHATLFAPDVAAKVLDVFRYDNPRLDRSGILVSEAGMFGLQLERIVSQANNPSRKCFFDSYDLKVFLAPVLTPEEQARLAQFLTGR